jgi:hypothetical protein
LIYWTFRKVHTLEISLREMRTLELSAGSWRLHLLTRRYLWKSFSDSVSRSFQPSRVQHNQRKIYFDL